MASADTPDKPGRFFRRRTFTVPTWRLMVPALVMVTSIFCFTIKHAYGWLAINEPVENAPYLIVEGWMPDYALEAAAEKAREAGMARTFCTGIPLDRGNLVYSYGNYAAYSEEMLEKLGVPDENVTAVPAPQSRTERTRTMAKALKAHLDAANIPSSNRRINLVTLGTHARRSRQVFREELGDSWNLGVISIPDQEADPDRWYFQSTGAKSVINEMIALTLGMFGAN